MTRETEKKVTRCFLIFLALLPIVFGIVAFLRVACGSGSMGKVTESFDLADYGKFDGITPSAKDYVQKEFQRYFPQMIPSSYENVHYHFATTDYGSAYEINLEFTIPNEEEFAAYMETVAPKEAFHAFLYDESYLEYFIGKNYMSFFSVDGVTKDFVEDGLTFNWIDHASIKRILIDPEQRTVIIVYLEAHSTLFASETLRLDYFLRRFHIDPRQYAADYGDGWERTS